MLDEAQPTGHGANVAVIFGGGVGRRMNNRGRPKQFLELHQKPIIIHTLEQFEFHDQIDYIAIACVEPWIGHLRRLIRRYEISKVRWIVSGGETGQASIYNALQAVESDLGDVDPTVLIHDAVRPVIPASTISANIDSVWEKGSGVTVAEARETILIEDADGSIREVTERSVTRVAKAPQSFRLSDILAVHRQALAEGITDAVDSCSLMLRYGRRVWAIRGTHDNIKITTPEDFYVFRALADLSESSQILGLQ